MLINDSKTKSNYLLSLLLFCYYGFAAGSFGGAEQIYLACYSDRYCYFYLRKQKITNKR